MTPSRVYHKMNTEEDEQLDQSSLQNNQIHLLISLSMMKVQRIRNLGLCIKHQGEMFIQMTLIQNSKYQ